MNCSKCSTTNLVNSKFCRQCGTGIIVSSSTIPDTPPQEHTPTPISATAVAVDILINHVEKIGDEPVVVDPERMKKVAIFLRNAQAFLDQGDLVNAATSAEEAAALHPHSIAVMTMRASLYERMGRFADAIAVLDKLDAHAPLGHTMLGKRALLKAKANNDKTNQAAPLTFSFSQQDIRKWLPLVASVTTVAIGLMLTLIVVKSRDNSAERLVAADGTPSRPVWNTAAAMQGSVQRQQQPTSIYAPPAVGRPSMPAPVGTRTDPFAPIAPRPDTTSSPVPVPDTQGTNPGRQLPAPGSVGDASSGVEVFQPVPRAGQTTNRDNPISATPPSSSSAPPIQAGPPASSPNGGGQPDRPTTKESGYIKIEMHPAKPNARPGASLNGTSSDTSSNGQVLNRALSLQRSGQYSGAIDEYKRALTDGADAGACYQGMGLCFDRLGERPASRVQYRKAIAAYLQHTEGPQRRSAEQSIAACRAALEVLGDG